MNEKTDYKINNDEFIIENYNNAKAFSSFLPSIAGIWGKPIWTFYVNRGQAIAGLGTKDKDGAILEFVAANKAYRLTPTHGFRTFIKIKDKFYEPFKNEIDYNPEKIIQRMHITSHLLKLVEINQILKLQFTVEYFTIPNENLPVLARILTIKNISNKNTNINIIDGMPMITPYGTGNFLLKNMSRLAEGWFSGVMYETKYNIPIYKLKVIPEDRPEVIQIKGGNFYFGYYSKKSGINKLPNFIVDPNLVFGKVTDFSFPKEFIDKKSIHTDLNVTAKNKTPSAMGNFNISLNPKEEIKYFSTVGNFQNNQSLHSFINRILKDNTYFDRKKEENKTIIEELGNNVVTKSSSPKLDNYCQQTFIDNLLRGGYPITIGKDKNKKIYYIYSRIHGDMEREYNNFVIMPEYFSQGNGSYRDVNQNRRNDIFFNTDVEDNSFIFFMNLIQTDGFNPLGIMGSKFMITDKKKILKIFNKNDKKEIENFIAEPFTLGGFFNFLEDSNIQIKITKEELLDAIVKTSKKLDYATPGTCYWSDHWHYNIDMLESYLSIYPEKLEEILLNKKVFTYYDNPMTVKPRDEKYVIFNNQPRQLNAVYLHPEKEKIINSRKEDNHLVRTSYGKGSVYKTILLDKMLCVIANKYASLDPEGVGVEMESDKPNWCDALNGLPGIFGSSTAESIELYRWVNFLLDAFKSINNKKEIQITEEVLDLMLTLDKITKDYSSKNFEFWDKTHTVKELYRKRVLFGVSGKTKPISINKLNSILEIFAAKVEKGIKKAIDKTSGVIRTNFENSVIKYKIIEINGKPKLSQNNLVCIKPLKFKQVTLPYFLEGPVHYLRIMNNPNKAVEFHKKVSKTGVYDKKLKMFKVNASIKDASINIGRIKIFTPGWLENESVWLHMEYKYLLELLRNRAAEDFYKISKTALIPFMNPEIYGRSIFENVSFIVSSAHPESELHGQGFVSRLSGATAEFLSMWIALTSGLKPFLIKDKKLYLQFKPQLASWLFTKEKEEARIYYKNSTVENISIPKNSFLFKFLGKTAVIYHNPKRKNCFGKDGTKIDNIKITYFNNKTSMIKGDIIPPPFSYDIRDGKVKLINVHLI